MAKAVGLSRMAIHRIWHTFGLQPHRSETFKLSNDPLLIEKIRDIVGLYLNPPAHAAVFCVDEKPQIQALDRTQPLLPMQPGQVERRTHDYKRHGTTTLFAALNAKTSEVITQFHQRHRSAQFREFLDLIEAQVPRRLDVHIIMDNYGTHKTPLIRNWFAKRPRFHVHFTPTYASWLSLVERWFALLTTKQLQRGAFRSVPQLKAAIQAFIDAHHENPKPFIWTKTADEILASIARFAERTADATSHPTFVTNHRDRTLADTERFTQARAGRCRMWPINRRQSEISVRDDQRRRGGQVQRVIIFGLLSVLSVGQGVMVAQSVSDSALGAWTLNHAKSTFSGAVP